MSNDLEERLRQALRPVDPGEPFTQRVLARIEKEPARSTLRVPRPNLRWISAGLAASFLLVGVVAHDWQARRTREGLEARRQLLEALQVTSKKLDIAYRAVNDRDNSAIAADDASGT